MIPYTSQPDEPGREGSVQVSLTGGSAASDRAIMGLSEAFGLETPPMQVPQHKASFESVSLDHEVTKSRGVNDAGFSPLQEAFAKDREVIASLGALSVLVLDETMTAPESVPASSELAPPAHETAPQRSVSEPDTAMPSFEDPVELLDSQPAVLPVPKTQVGEGIQSVVVASADGFGIAGAVSTDPAETSSELSASSSAVDLSALFLLMHEAISRHKEYPFMARRNQREGTATVGFELHPDGAIDGVTVVSSSGFSRLDKAALFALTRAAPFEAAKNYLEQARHIEMNIVFSLQ